MSKRLLATIGMVAALGWGTPFLMADHGEKDKHQHGNKHNDRDDDAWERRDGYQYRVYGGSDDRPPGWGQGKRPVRAIAGCLRAKPRNTDAAFTCTRAVSITTTRMKFGGS